MTFDHHSNFAYGIVLIAPSPAASGTSLTLRAGQGAVMPTPPFNGVVWPFGVQPASSNAEIVRVTAIVGDVLTIARVQEGSSARTIIATDQFSAAITAKTITDIEAQSGGVAIGGDLTGTNASPVVASVKNGKTPLTADQNLSDLSSAGTARTNLGLGSAATHASTDFDAAGLAASTVATETARAQAAEAALAPLASPALTGTPTAPTVSGGDNSTSIATTAFVSAAIQASQAGLVVKNAANEATTAALPANTYVSGVLTANGNGALTVDGIAVAANDRVLVKNEAAPANNGVYTVTATGSGGSAYVLTRVSDMNTGTQVPGAFVFVQAGTANTGAGFSVVGSGPFTIGTTAINWTQFSGTGQITAGTAINIAGNQINAVLGTTSSSAAAGNDSRITGAAQKASNLSDLASAATARTNLGLGSAATHASTDFDAAGAASAAQTAAEAASDASGSAAAVQAASLQKSSNLGDVASPSTARTNLGLGSAATQASSAFDTAGAAAAAQSAAQTSSLQKASNLSDLANAATARTNLGLGSSATQASGAFDAAGTSAADIAAAQVTNDSRYVHQDGTGLPADVVTGTLIQPVAGVATSATSAPSGSGPYTLAISIPTVSIGNAAFLWAVAGTAPTTPTGWTLETSDASTDAKSYLFKRVIDGTEGASLTVSWATNPNQVVMHMVPVSGQAAGEVYGSFTTHAGAASSITASVTTPSNDCLVLYFQGSSDTSSETSTPPSGFTELADANAQFGFRQASTGYQTAAVSGSTTVNATVTENSTAALTMVMVAVPSNNYQPISKAEVLGTGLAASDLGAMTTGPDGRILPAQQQPSAFGTWQDLGAIGSGGWQTAVECSPHDSNRWLVGGDMLGVGISTDGGDSWGPTFGFSSWEINRITWHPTDGKKVWVATWSGPYLSTDGGHNFKPMISGMSTTDFPYSRVISDIVLNPTNTQEIWAFGGDQRGSPFGSPSNYGQVFHSTNEGASWSVVATVNSGANITSGAISADGSTLLMVSAGHGVYKSTDGGVTWTITNNSGGITSTAPVMVQAHPVTAGTWYCNYALQSGTSNMYTSTDNAVTWSVMGPTATTDGGWRTLKIGADGVTLWVSTNSTTMYKSADGGATWNRMLSTKPPTGFSATLGVQFGAIGICPTNTNFVMFGTSDDLIRTKDGGVTADSAATRYIPYLNQVRGRGFCGLLGTRVKFHPNVQGTILTTAYDAGAMMLSTDDGLSWTRPTRSWDPFDGGYDVSVGGPTGKVIWVSLGQASIFNGLGVSTDGGVTFTVRTGSPLPNQFGGTRSYNAIRPVSSDGLTAIATVGGSIYRTTNGGTSWSLMSGSGHSFQELLVDRSTLGTGSTTTVYASGPSGVYISTDGGQTWTGVANSPQGACTYMKFDPNDHTKLYICCWQPASNATANQGLWRLDIGLGTWTRIFNNNCTRDVAVNPFDSNSIVVTTDDNPFHGTSSATGVWWSRDAGVTWQQINTGLRMLRIWSIDFDPWHPGRVICGANGGGFWTTRLISGLTSGDARANRLAPEQLGLKGWHEKIPGSSTEVGQSGSFAGPLDASNRVPATQAPAKILKSTQTTAYTVAATDMGTVITVTNASPVNVTFNAGIVPYLAAVAYNSASDDMVFIRQGGAGQITVVGGSGVTVTGYPSSAVKTAGQNATVVVTQTAQDAWLVGGQNST